MSRARTFWKWFGGTLGGLLVLLGAAVLGLHFWLASSPELGPQIVARVERLTGLRISYAQLDARLSLQGPELVFRDAVVSMAGQHDPLVTARAGRVGFDWWRALRTGRLASGRVVLEGARVYVFLTKDGIELRGQGVLQDADNGSHLSLRDLPVGHVRIEDSTVTVNDLRTKELPWRVDRVQLDLERDPGELLLSGRVQLPDALGAHLDLDLQMTGDLSAAASLDWSAELVLSRASLAGWTALVPRWRSLPTAGRGDLQASVSGHGGVLRMAEARLDLTDVRLRAIDGAAPGRLRRLAGVLSVTQRGQGWVAAGHDLVIDPGHDPWNGGRFELGYDPSSGVTGGSFSLRSPSIRLEALAALVPLVPEGTLREAGLALAPRGTLTLVDVRARRDPHLSSWHLDGGLRYAGLGFGAWRAVPGLTGLDGDWVGRGARGRVRLQSAAMTLDLARLLREPVKIDSAAATLDYWWQPDGLRLASDDVVGKSVDGNATGSARLWLPADAEESPRLVLDFKLAGIEVRHAARYLPGRILSPGVNNWLDHAFLAGAISAARLEFAGELRRFPFRGGGGLFRVRLGFEGMRIHYQDQFDDIEDGSGEAEFRNAGFTAHASCARIRGLRIRDATAAMADFANALLTAQASVEGDVNDGLGYLQSSIVGPKLGDFFMNVSGHGPMSARVDLQLPLRHFADRMIIVDGKLNRVSAHIPGLDDPLKDIVGAFTLHDRELTVPQITATVLGGPARARARTVAGPSGRPGERVLVVDAQGRATAERVQAVLGISRGVWLEGGADWQLQARMPRLEWRPKPDPVPADAPPDAIPTVHELQTRFLPGTIQLESGLEGLALDFPAPLAKAAGASLPLKVELAVDPGLAPDAPRPPWLARRKETPRTPTLNARLQLGRDAGVVQWRHDDDWHLARGTLRFGDGKPELRDSAGVWLEGRIPEYDLSAWLRVHLSAVPSRGLGETLRGGKLVVDRFGIFGFHFPDVAMLLDGHDEAWNVTVDGPDTRGRLVVPWDLLGRRPLTLDMDRLVIGEHARDAGSGPEEQIDPKELPAMAIRVKSLEIQKRRFGSLDADLSRTRDGLKLDRALVKGTSFQATAHGSWLVADGGQKSVVSVALDSSDVLDSLAAWGFEPALTAHQAHATGELHWPGSIDSDMFGRMIGTVKISVEEGQVLTVNPGAGRVLGLMSLTALPRRLMLDFSDLTDKGFAFDSIKGDFEFRDGNAYTSNLLLKGPAAEIGIVGRTGIAARDYDQTAKVTGHLSGPLAAAGVLAAGPAVGAALLLFSTVFKESLGGIARGYYRITGSWEKPNVERIGAGQAREAEKATSGEAPH